MYVGRWIKIQRIQIKLAHLVYMARTCINFIFFVNSKFYCYSLFFLSSTLPFIKLSALLIKLSIISMYFYCKSFSFSKSSILRSLFIIDILLFTANFAADVYADSKLGINSVATPFVSFCCLAIIIF